MTTPSDAAGGRSRRAVLSACGAGLAALAGCADLDAPGLGGDDGPEYDPGPLRDVAGRTVPPGPDAFPVSVPDAMPERHRERARDLLATVPERPDVPNGVVARRLREEREHVTEHLRERSDAATGLGRLSSARGDRGDAAELSGIYRAAVGEIDRETVADRRAGIRAGLRRFREEWDYRGADPASALVVGAELEDLAGTIRRHAEAWPPVPADPATDVFRVGELLRDVELGEASLADAGILRERYLDGSGDDPRSYRSAITAAAHRLDRRASWASRRLHEFDDVRAADLPFDRSIEGTPAERLFRHAQHYAGIDDPRDGEALRDGDHATAALEAGRTLAGVRAFRAVLDAIEAGEYGPPDESDRVTAAYEEAVAALETAREVAPTAVSAELTWPAREAIEDGRYGLDESNGRSRDVHDAIAMFAYARLYAEEVPDAVAAVVDALEEEA